MSTQLKTVDIKGKDYVEVNTRIKYFRENYPLGSIVTDIVKIDGDMVIFKAQVVVDDKVRATGYAYEREGSTFINKTSYIENCETSAIGRALGIFGIGIDGSVASAEEVANAIANQPKTASKSSDDEKKQYWNDFTKSCKMMDIEPIEFLTEFAQIDMKKPNEVQNAVVKYLKSPDMFVEQLENYKQFKLNK